MRKIMLLLALSACSTQVAPELPSTSPDRTVPGALTEIGHAAQHGSLTATITVEDGRVFTQITNKTATAQCATLAVYRFLSQGGMVQQLFTVRSKDVPVHNTRRLSSVLPSCGGVQIDVLSGDTCPDPPVNYTYPNPLPGNLLTARLIEFPPCREPKPEPDPKIPGPKEPFCGDGIVNQEYEQCDGGEQCTDSCQFVGEDCDSCEEYGECVYSIIGSPRTKQARCQQAGGAWTAGNTNSEHCTLPFPGIADKDFNLVVGQSDEGCLRNRQN